ncbi:MAG: GntR family transcriptional regulator [Syntrophaceae bacterium]
MAKVKSQETVFERATPKNRQPYERVVGILAQQIFFSHVKPGLKLATERQLAEDLEVDRSSLRVALKHLESMGVLDIRQGDGIYVKDYLKHAGIEFVATLFEQLRYGSPKADIDEYFMEECWQFWSGVMPEILRIAIERMTPRNAKDIMDTLDEELAHLSDKNRIIELELSTQDYVAEVAGNVMYMLLANTARPIRRKMVELFVRGADEDMLKAHLLYKKDLIRKIMLASDRAGFAERYREHLQSLRKLLREKYYAAQNAQALE